jgi:hypothetical protein
MTSAPVEIQNWPRGRWLAAIIIILTGQVGFIFWLGGQKSAATILPARQPRVYLPSNPEIQWPGVSDPTLFILANQRGFSGEAWMKIPRQEYDLPTWNEPTRPLALPVAELGAGLNQFLKTNASPRVELVERNGPEFPAIVTEDDSTPAQSKLTVEGEIASRPLRSNFKLDSWPANYLLSNSIVQIGVDRDGDVLSAILTKDGKSGSKDADNSALNLGKSARFEPLVSLKAGPPGVPQDRLRWGRLVFHWQTVLPAGTNAGPATL